MEQVEALSHINMLEKLHEIGAIRAIDFQFATFIYKQQYTTQPQIADSVALLACAVSCEFGRGHICIHLETLNVAELLSFNFWIKRALATDGLANLNYNESLVFAQQLELQFDVIAQINWRAICLQSNLISVTKTAKLQALPLTFQNDRIYLTRNWHYEDQVAQKLQHLARPIELTPNEQSELRATLNNLFARNYQFLFNKLKANVDSTPTDRQQWVSDMLDINQQNELDWECIDQALQRANQVDDLAILDQLVDNKYCLNWQKIAAAVALTRQFAVISGGPGTGKTTTVAKLLAAFISQSISKPQDPNGQSSVPLIKLVAPTGKAAARLTESISSAIDALPVSSEIKAQIPAQSSTIHRLLGARPNSTQYRHNANNPLHVDILVVDEASMVDLPMMHRLLSALPPHARLILLGDKDQLASVEAGAILADICSFADQGYSAAQSQQLSQLTGFTCLSSGSREPLNKQVLNKQSPENQEQWHLADSLCVLQKSYRFTASSGIGQLAKAVNRGNAKQVKSVWLQGFSDINLYQYEGLNPIKASKQEQDNRKADEEQVTLTRAKMVTTLLDMLTVNYQEYTQLAVSSPDVKMSGEWGKSEMEEKAKKVLQAFSNTRLLCALREGEYGIQGMNVSIEEALISQGQLPLRSNDLWYEGRPVMVTQNEYTLGLNNGDIGICLADKSSPDGRLRVYFEMPDGGIKGVLPSRVPRYELAFAMTIHKSQGSEFTNTFILLPPKFSPLLTRELIYTGITRAKTKLNVFTNNSIFMQGIVLKTIRASGLSVKLSVD